MATVGIKGLRIIPFFNTYSRRRYELNNTIHNNNTTYSEEHCLPEYCDRRRLCAALRI